MFGWCSVCRRTAEYYCKESRIAICGLNCKLRNLETEKWIKGIHENISVKVSEKKKKLLRDSVAIFKNIFHLAFKDTNKKDSTTLTLRISLLEIIRDLLENPGPTFKNNTVLIEFIRKRVCESLLKNCVSNEEKIFSLSVEIFYFLVKRFRVHLKQEIAVFIEELFLKILESLNSKYAIKYYLMLILRNFVQDPRLALELFVNYDCSEEFSSIFERIVQMLSRIAMGKFARVEYASMLNQAEEKLLRDVATNSMLRLLIN